MKFTNNNLVDLVRSKASHYLDETERDERVLEALLKVDRRNFLTYRKKVVLPIDISNIESAMKLFNEINEGDLNTKHIQRWHNIMSSNLICLERLIGYTVQGNAVIAELDRFHDWIDNYYTPVDILLQVFTDFRIKQFREIFDIQSKVVNVEMYKENVRNLAYIDIPLPIGAGQTCSQPSMVAFMADKLQIEEGMKVLEIGTGCGYSTAVMGHLLSSEGYLVTIEINQHLFMSSRHNLLRHSRNAEILQIHDDGRYGWPDDAPYDRIYLTAGVDDTFHSSKYREQLNTEGLLLYPEEKGDLILENREGRELARYEGVRFVPLL